MTGWNMPPGCTVNDIPGNGPEDNEVPEALELLRQWLDHPELLRVYESDSLHELRKATRAALDRATEPGVTGK